MKVIFPFLCLILFAHTTQARQNEPVSEEAKAAAIEEASQAATAWLALMKEGDVRKTWETAAVIFKANIGADEWVESITNVRDPLGPFGERTLQSSEFNATLPDAPKGPYVVFIYETKAKAIPAVIETVIMIAESGTWKTVGYYINQPE